MRENILLKEIKSILNVKYIREIYVDCIDPDEDDNLYHNRLRRDSDGDYQIVPFSWWINSNLSIVRSVPEKFVIVEIDRKRFKFYKKNG